ncbi:MAG: trypsin-like peptidase domain-containing protein [Roseburia sp.]|nr:trypsin-like peptidase domain-containing protein [Roseburia sp.]
MTEKGNIFMDNQNYDNIYGQNANQTNNVEPDVNQQNQSEPVQTNRYEEPGFTFYNGNTYRSNAQYQNPNYQNSNYQNTNYQTYTPYEEPKKQKPKREKKERKSGGFGVKLVKCAALALVFGLVAGSVMIGMQYAAAPLLGTGDKATEVEQPTLSASNNSNITSTAISNTYVAVDVSDIVDEVMPSIVAITNISETEYRSFWGGSQVYESTSAGSGIIISSDSEYLYIATNNHVIDGAKTLTVTFANEATVSAEVKGTDPSIDLAVVKVALSSIESSTMDAIKVATIGNSDELRVGEASIAIGNALGYGQSVTMGVISAVNRVVTVSDSGSNTGYTAELIQTDAAINPGNSGGALLNARGEVIGINSVKYADTDVEGIGYAIPMSTAAPIIEELITKEKVDESNSSYLGIAGVDVTNDVASTYNMPTGVYVAQVLENTAAAKYGILPGDIITKFDGKEITSMDSLTGTLQYYAAGTTVEVTVMRSHNGQYQEQVLEVVLGKKN